MLLNQSWYWDFETWPDAGTQSCGIAAHNSLGEVALVMFDLVVGPAGFGAPTGGGSDASVSYPNGDPRNPPPTGTSSRSGQLMGYFNPVTGLTYSDPGGTQVCGNCGTDTSNQVNITSSTPDDTVTTGDDDNNSGGYSNSGM